MNWRDSFKSGILTPSPIYLPGVAGVVSNPEVVPYKSVQTTLWNTERTAKYLDISVRTLYRYIRSRKLGYVKLDGALRFDPEDVKRFLRKRTLKAV